MSIVYLLKNQHKQYLDKSGEWVAADSGRALFRVAHKDEAINRKVEFSVKNFDLRIAIFEAALNAKGEIELAAQALTDSDNEQRAVKPTIESANNLVPEHFELSASGELTADADDQTVISQKSEEGRLNEAECSLRQAAQ